MSADEIALRAEHVAWERVIEAVRAMRDRSHDDVDDETTRQLRRDVRDSLVSLGAMRAARMTPKDSG
jgi:hypothetical protein